MRNRKSGFTLIELLIVVVIIGILAAILIPILHQALIRARRVDSKNTIHVLEVAVKEYKGDFNVFPNDGDNDGDGNGAPEGNLSNVDGILAGTNGINVDIQGAPITLYCDGSLLRHLDGDALNDDIANPARQPRKYFDPKQEQIVDFDVNPNDLDPAPASNRPVILDAFGKRIFYNELESETRFTKNITSDDPRARADIFSFRTFQIFSQGNELDDPARWITNFRNP